MVAFCDRKGLGGRGVRRRWRGAFAMRGYLMGRGVKSDLGWRWVEGG